MSVLSVFAPVSVSVPDEVLQVWVCDGGSASSSNGSSGFMECKMDIAL